MSSISDVTNFFADRSVLVTGGTGFLGKVLIEKLLRSVPRLRKIYVVIRPQKGVGSAERWRTIVNTCPLFESVRETKIIQENEDQTPQSQLTLTDKVVPVHGDITMKDLGLSADDSKMVCENVSVVFHCAAAVRFDERMRLAIQMNVEGTLNLLRLCDKMKRLDALVHTSTAYCNCDRENIVEMVYPSPVPWRRLLESVEWLTDEMFDLLTPLLIVGRPNSYTFTKAIAESMIADDKESNQHLPIVIVRPSIVTAIWRDPLPGWIDNVNGATGLIALGAKGLLRSLSGNLNSIRADLIPVDVVANTLIVAAWHRGSAKGLPMPVIHCTTGALNPFYWGQMITSTLHFFVHEMPMLDLYRIPGGGLARSSIEHRLRLVFDHMVPAYVIDCICKFTGRRPIMVRAYKKIIQALGTLEYFYTHQWSFESNGIAVLNGQLSDADRAMFHLDVKEINWTAYLHDYNAGVRKFIFKEDPSNVAEARKVHSRRRLLTKLVITGFMLFGCLLIRYLFFQ